ncbi:MAG: ATP-dependent DNA helicase [Candidatus Micrarchaeia archaeon]
MDFPFRFDSPRAFQEDMMSSIYNALKEGRSIFINAPTGIGKTDASISAAIKYANEENKSVLFLTPKMSQHLIAIEALNGIEAKFHLGLKYIDIVGKPNLCANSDINNINYESFYKACEDLIKAKKCPYYTNFKAMKDIPFELEQAARYGHNKFFDACYSYAVCPYEATMKLAKGANVIIGNYNHILNPYIKELFLNRIGEKYDDLIIIWDEAHNIIDSANDYSTISLTLRQIDGANEELKKIGSEIDLSYLSFTIKKLAKEKLYKKAEDFVYKDEIPEEISKNSEEIIKNLEDAAMVYLKSHTESKRSYIMHIARFLGLWTSYTETDICIISVHGGSPSLKISSLYPEKILSVFEKFYSNIFMSATMNPVKMYMQMLGLENAALKEYPSPFPESNRLAIIDDTVTTKYEERSQDQYKKIAERIEKARAAIDGNTVVFFPSFEMLKSVNKYLRNENILIQEKSMNSIKLEKLLGNFKSGKRNLLLGVMGGSMSEGVDYPNNIIKCVIVVGIPLAVPNLEITSRINYLNKKFDNMGTAYAYIIPALRKAVQAAGRAIRSEKDKAVIIFMDKRYKWPMYLSVIKDSIPKIYGIERLPEIGEFLKE